MNDDTSTSLELAPSGNVLTRVDFDPQDRAGILTQPRFLAAHAHQAEVSWVHRGLLVRRQLLCQTLPDPPPDVSMDGALDPNRVTNPQCSACHTLIDPVGRALDHFDAVGAYRTELSDGSAVDAAGRLEGARGIEPDFDGALELSQRLADSEEVHSCVTRQWLRYAAARNESSEDACDVSRIENRFEESGYDMRELLVAIAVSDSFRHRRRSEVSQ